MTQSVQYRIENNCSFTHHSEMKAAAGLKTQCIKHSITQSSTYTHTIYKILFYTCQKELLQSFRARIQTTPVFSVQSANLLSLVILTALCVNCNQIVKG